MRLGSVYVLFWAAASAQVRQIDPIDVAVQAYQRARTISPSEAAAKREEALQLLESSVDKPGFEFNVSSVAQLYEDAALGAKARSIVQSALARVESAGGSQAARVHLLNTLADYWREDQNLLRSLSYREKAAALSESASSTGRRRFTLDQLANTYQLLGRKADRDATLEKKRALGPDDMLFVSTLDRLLNRQKQRSDPQRAEAALNNQPEPVEQTYRRLMDAAERCSIDSRQPLLTVLEDYARFLIQSTRWSEVPMAIDRYRDAVIAARGEETGWREHVLRLTLDFEKKRGAHEAALRVSRDLLELVESLNGSNSTQYMSALETLAACYTMVGDFESAVSSRRKAIALSDALSENDHSRVLIRVFAAIGLGHLGRFEEADLLANEAVMIARKLEPPMPYTLDWLLRPLRELRETATRQ